MADKQTVTGTPFIVTGALTQGNTSLTPYEVISSDTVDRRIYGIGVTLNDGTTHTQVRFFINNGTSNFQLNLNSITANSGFLTGTPMYDLLGTSTIASVFAKQYDVIGVPYFNLPAGWSFQASSFITLGAGEELRFWAIGEKYDGTGLTLTSSTFKDAVSFANSDSTNTKTILASSSENRRIYGLTAQSTDTTARVLYLKLNNGVTSYTVSTINIPANSGATTSITPVDVFSNSNIYPVFGKQYDTHGLPYFNLPAGWSIEGSFQAAITSGTTIKFVTIGDSYI